MEIFNRASQEMKPLRRTDTTPYLIVKKRGVYMTAPMKRFLKLEKDTYVHFVNDDTEWFLFTDSNEAGFALKEVKKHGGFWIYSTSLSQKIFDTTGFKKEKRFTLEKTDVELDGRKLLKLSNKNIPTFIC